MAEKLTADLPKVSWFLGLSQVELAEITNLDKPRWNRILNRTGINEATLNKLSVQLGMQPHILLFAINLRREGVRFSAQDVALLA